MKKIVAIMVTVAMIFSLAAVSFAADAEVTWEDYQKYLIDTAGSNAPDLQEFIDQVEAIGSWDELDQTVSPWDQMFTTIGLSTWEEFEQGIVKEAQVQKGQNMGGASPEGESPEGESPEGQAPEGESPEGQAPSGTKQNISDLKVSSFATNNSDSSRPQDEGHIYVGYAITDGKLDTDNSNWETDDINHIVLDNVVEGEGFTGIRAYGDTTVSVSGALILQDNSDGQFASDFTGTGAGITGADGATVYVNDMMYLSEGFGRSFAIVQNGTMVVNNSEITALGKDPLLDAYAEYYNSANTSMMLSPPWVLGIQGGIRALNVLGKGSTLVIADSTINAGGWADVSTDGCTNPYLYLYNTELNILPMSQGGMYSGWKLLGYDEDAYGTGYGTYNIGNSTENFYGVTFNGQTYALIATSAGPSNYYGLKAGEVYEAVSEDGAEVGKYEAEADVPTVINTVFGFMSHGNSEINVHEGTIVNTEEAAILYKNGKTTWTLDGAQINAKSGILAQLMDNDDQTVGGFNPFNTYLIEEPGFKTEGYDGAVSYVFTTDTEVVPGKTYYTSDTDNESGYAVVEDPTDEGTVAYYEKSTGGADLTLNLANGVYEGDIFNATGYYNQAGDALTVNIADTAVLDGDIALTSHIHGLFLRDRNVDDVIAEIEGANEFHKSIGGYYDGLEDIEYVFIDENGQVTENKDEAFAIQFTKFSIAEYYLLGHVLNYVNYNGISSVDVYVDGVWNVKNQSLVTYLNVAKGAQVYGEIIECEDGSLEIVPSDELIAPGEYGNALMFVEAPGSGGGPGGGESADGPSEGESAEGESPEGESPEGEAPAPAGESPEGESPEGEAPAPAGESPEGEAPAPAPAADKAAAAPADDVQAAFVEYIHEWLLNEDANNDQMTPEIVENEFMPMVEKMDFESFPADMLYNGMLETGSPMTFEEFAAQYVPEEESKAEASGDDMLEAYKAYMNEWLLAELAVNPQMSEEQLPEFQACIEANDYSQFPGDMFFNGMLENGVAMTYDEFVASQK